MDNQLIIIGNGFDLNAGLASSYSNFFNFYFYEDSNHENHQTDAKKGKNYWFSRFWRIHEEDKGWNKKAKWSDVEEVLLHDLTEIESKLTKIVPMSLSQFIFEEETTTMSGEISEGLRIRLYFERRTNKAFSNNFIETTEGKENLFRLLMVDLKKLEKEFTDYLILQMPGNSKYSINYSGNFERLFASLLLFEDTKAPEEKSDAVNLSDERKEYIKSNITKFGILSFNFTRPYFGWLELESRVESVHGNLRSKNIMFGIDGQDIKLDSLVAPFTKTYRKLAPDNRSQKSLHWNFSIDEDINVIKIYGHGLSESDYSYYQSIFDSIDLYHGKTEVIFFYNPAKEDVEQKERLVYQLIKKYGESFDNQDHGRNLLHKLLLEGRLRLEALNIGMW